MICLGQASNYSFGRTFRHLCAWGTHRDDLRLKTALAERYGVEPSQVVLYHTGRSALAAAVQATTAPNLPVIIPGLTCIAVVRAVRAAGCLPVFCDIDPKTLQYDWQRLEKILQQSPIINQDLHKPIDNSGDVCYNGSIVAQNTLGLPLDMRRLERLAQKYHFRIIEDLAHCAGRFYPDGREIGTVGAAAALSFGKGKAIDTISGGALIVKNGQLPQPPSQKPKRSARLRDRWYPFFGGISRGLWRIGLGKALMAAFLRLHWVERSADADLNLNQRLTYWQAKLALRQLKNLPKTPLREHKFVQKRAELLAKLAKNGYYLSEIWYDVPVSPARYQEEANFPESDCPNAVKVAQEIINLPTWYSEKKLQKARRLIQSYEVEA